MKLHWRIRHKLAAGLVLVIGMTGILSAGAFSGLYSYRRSNKIFNYHHEQLELLGYLELTGTELVLTGLNVNNGDVADTADPNVAKQEKLQRFARIRAMLDKYRHGLENAVDSSFTNEGAERQSVELDKMAGYIDELEASLTGSQPQVAANVPSLMKPFWTSIHERDIIAKLIFALGKLRGVIHAEITRHVEADRGNYRSSLAVVYSTSVLVLLMLVVLVWLGYRAVFHPIRELHRGVTKLTDMKLDSRVRLNSGDEMQELGEAFNKMADRLQGIYKDLNRQVEERSRQLIRSERLASVGFLAAGVAHEINNPLASIAFCGEALDSRLQQALPANDDNTEVIHNYLEMIQQEAFRCKAITEKLLDFSRVGEPERVETDIVGLVRNVIEMVQHLGRTKGKNVVFEPLDSIVANINPHELKQVLLNLVVNGLESVDDGGTVVVEVTKQNAGVEITVSDDGCGMNDEVMRNLFEPFFTRNRTGKGTGLGLSISHLIISQHGGSLDAYSAGPNMGSTFTVRLPQKEQQTRQLAPALAA